MTKFLDLNGAKELIAKIKVALADKDPMVVNVTDMEVEEIECYTLRLSCTIPANASTSSYEEVLGNFKEFMQTYLGRDLENERGVIDDDNDVFDNIVSGLENHTLNASANAMPITVSKSMYNALSSTATDLDSYTGYTFEFDDIIETTRYGRNATLTLDTAFNDAVNALRLGKRVIVKISEAGQADESILEMNMFAGSLRTINKIQGFIVEIEWNSTACNLIFTGI